MIFSRIAGAGLASIGEGESDRGWLTVTGANPFSDVGIESSIRRLWLNIRIIDAGCLGDVGQMEIVLTSSSGPIDFQALAFIAGIAAQFEAMRNPDRALENAAATRHSTANRR